MKILCLWPLHNKTNDRTLYNNNKETDFVIVEKPESALIRAGQPFFVPDWATHFEAEVMFAIRIHRLGRYIAPQFAARYYSEATLGVNFVARDRLDALSAKGLPWDLAIGFDQSATFGKFCPIERLLEEENLASTNLLNDGVAMSSRFYTLKSGDFLMFSLGRTPIRVKEGDILEESVGEEQLLNVRIK